MSQASDSLSENLSWTVPTNYEEHIQSQLKLAGEIPGYLTPKEIRFLCQLALVPEELGELLEIGSFQGKSTTILAKSLERMGHSHMHAVDPLCLDFTKYLKNAETLPPPRDVLDRNLRAYRVENRVEFHQMKAEELAETWDKPLRVLWIDGDHTYQGTKIDFDCFAPHLVPGAIIAFHDVLHKFDGPVRVFLEQVLLSEQFGACGLTGSIGWAQYIGDQRLTIELQRRKQSLSNQLARLVPCVTLGRSIDKGLNRFKYKLYKSLIPHSAISSQSWVNELRRVA